MPTSNVSQLTVPTVSIGHHVEVLLDFARQHTQAHTHTNKNVEHTNENCMQQCALQIYHRVSYNIPLKPKVAPTGLILKIINLEREGGGGRIPGVPSMEPQWSITIDRGQW